MFGIGVANPVVKAITDAQGNVNIVSGNHRPGIHTRGRRNYQDQAGDFATLTLSGGIYQLAETDGTVEVFNSSGTLNDIESADGNKTIYAYTDSELTSITDTATGDVTTFAYNAQGYVNQITDPTGQITNLTYDSSGHLLSVTSPSGTTTYSYITSGPTPELNALRVGHPTRWRRD